MRSILATASAAVLFSALAACSDDKKDTPTTTPPAATTSASAPATTSEAPSPATSSEASSSEAPSSASGGAVSIASVGCDGATIKLTITNSGFTFSPNDSTLADGDIVKFQVGSIHNVASDEQEALSVDFGGSGCFQVSGKGEINYYCVPHRSMGMTGVLKVG